MTMHAGDFVQTTALANEAQLKAASFIKLEAASGKGKALKQFLIDGGDIVKKTEPDTKVWFALKENENTYGIFDAFVDNDGRAKHFAGKVAAALKEQSPTLIMGSWDGVSKHIHNYEILSSSMSKKVGDSKEANLILLTAKPGKEKALEAFLTSGAKIVEETEPKTLFWTALKLDESHYAIFDTFADESGRKAHFTGKVAHALQEKAPELVMNGWDEGVLKQVHDLKVIAKVTHL